MDKKTKILTVAAVVVLLLGIGIWAVVLQRGNTAGTGASAGTENAAGTGQDGTEGTGDGNQKETAASQTEGTAGAVISAVESGDWVEITLADSGSTAGDGVEVDENTITIKQGGNYRISGVLTEGRLVVKAGEKEDVVLSLAGVTVTNTTEEALEIKNAKSVILNLEADSTNTFTSGTAVEITENPGAETDDDTTDADEEESAKHGTIYSKSDVTICGDGALNVNGYLNNGVQVKGTLSLEGGVLTVNAVNNGLKGSTAVLVSAGTVQVLSGNDGVKSSGTDDGQGCVSITGGTLDITSYGDGVQAADTLTMAAGTVNVTTKGDVTADNNQESFGNHGWGQADGGWDMAAETDISTKGLKAGSLVNITGGTVQVDATDDAVHSNDTVNVSGGTLTLSTGDDGIHADTALNITDGTITITKSYEGLEANQIDISGGDIFVTASDDGMNASGGSSSGGFGFGFGWGASSSSEDLPNLYIRGGSIYVNAGGDGLDSNGNLYVEGGTIIVDGPSDSANGALDSGSENGGVLQITGGTIIAVGASGMAESFDADSTQCSFKANMSSSWKAGDTITITASDGTVLFTYAAAKSGNSIVFSSPELVQGETYTVTAGDQTTTISQDSISAGSSSSGFGGMGGGGRGNGGFGGGRR
jgi:hypothetical protein